MWDVSAGRSARRAVRTAQQAGRKDGGQVLQAHLVHLGQLADVGDELAQVRQQRPVLTGQLRQRLLQHLRQVLLVVWAGKS